MHKLIIRASQLKNETDILMQINPKEKKRRNNELDLEEPIFEPYCEIRVRPRTIKYPTIEDNYPGFFEETSLMHLCKKYMPDRIKQ